MPQNGFTNRLPYEWTDVIKALDDISDVLDKSPGFEHLSAPIREHRAALAIIRNNQFVPLWKEYERQLEEEVKQSVAALQERCKHSHVQVKGTTIQCSLCGKIILDGTIVQVKR